MAKKRHPTSRWLVTLFVGTIAGFFSISSWSALVAQPPGGFPGGGFPGGPGGGGPPGMGFGGGGPPGMGFGGGGDRGGRGGGGWGGGAPGGGFDPSQFISRMDTNGNGSIDPEEAQGPARFMLERMARNNPKIDLSKPIPISVITESFQQMRNGGGGGPGGDNGGDETVDTGPATLVPTFGIKVDKSPVPGFGASGSKMAIKVEDRDLREAEDRVRRYDKNNDGMLEESELKEARWAESPMQWDRNKDGKLSKQEVALRYARRRETREGQDNAKKAGSEDKNARDRAAKNDEAKANPHPFEKQASFRMGDPATGVVRPSGVPEWFSRDDINGDNQVSMNEFARRWDESTLEEFSKFDTNGDGYITVKEVLAGVKKGYLKGSSSSSSTAATSDPASPAGEGSSAPAASKPANASSGASAKSKEEAEMRDWVKKKIDKLDKDKNGFLTPDEFKDGSTKFGDVDTDGNGQINLEEYVIYRNARQSK